MNVVDGRCIWTNRPDPGTARVALPEGAYGTGDVHVCPAHRERTLRYLKSTRRAVRVILSVLFLGVAAVLAAPGLGVDWLAAAGLCAIGLAFVAFPVPTPQTVQWLGLRRSVLLVRVLGCAIVGVGLFELPGW